MPSNSTPSLILAPFTDAQLTAHFHGVQSLLRRAVETHGEITVLATSHVPGSTERDVWQLRLSCSPQLVGNRVEWVAASAVDLFIESPEDDVQSGQDLWDAGTEVITSAIELPTVTAAVASWLLREGWLARGAGMEACVRTDIDMIVVGDKLSVLQRSASPVPAMHWQRAAERRATYGAAVDDEACEAAWAAWQATYKPTVGQVDAEFIDHALLPIRVRL